MQSSRITLVGHDENLEPKADAAHGMTSLTKEFSYLDHLLAVFCIYRPRRTEVVPAQAEPRPELEDNEVGAAITGDCGATND